MLAQRSLIPQPLLPLRPGEGERCDSGPKSTTAWSAIGSRQATSNDVELPSPSAVGEGSGVRAGCLRTGERPWVRAASGSGGAV